jgi:hypothetical protein
MKDITTHNNQIKSLTKVVILSNVLWKELIEYLLGELLWRQI